MSTRFAFPTGFLWGVATASYQIEGAAHEDGRLPSVWDTFSETVGKTKNGDTGAVACDHYHRYREDIQIMKDLGVKAYRFSIAWPRVVPDGDGEVNQKGLDFYSRLVDALLEAGIEPFATCYHWDMPAATYKKHGGWHGRQSAYDFARYAGFAARALGDRIKNWFTINEFVCYTHLSYGLGMHAPGEKVDKKRLNQLTHHAILGHGLAVDAIRSNAPKPVQVGLAENVGCFVPAIETPENIAAARQAFRTENGALLVPVITGAYDPAWLEREGADAPKITEGDLKQISRPVDFVALNIYTGTYVRAAGNGYEKIDFPAIYPVYNVPWLRHMPDALYWGLRCAQEDLGIKKLYISENGCCGSDVLTESGEVLDIERVQYLREYLRSAHRAINDGINLQGYFQWSMMDNFEWAEGYTKRFGLYYTDYCTQKRIPKLSAKFYSQVTRQNRVM
ncbi:MAG TPA: GH1 family beta-glucosidase [Planctomycetota bacterium]|jgi:beta-glucosidase